ALVTKKRKMEELRTENLSEKRRKIHENSPKSKDETGDKENLDSAKQINKQENNTLKDKKNMVNNCFNITEEERSQKDMSILETPPGSKDNIEGSRKFAESESSRMVSYNTNAIVVDVDSKPQNVINSLELEKTIADAQSKLRKQYKKYKEAKRHKQERSGGNNLNENNTDKELDVLVQDIAAEKDVKMLSQKDESLETLLEKDRNEENQQEVQKRTESMGINMLNVDHEYVQIQAKESNVVEQ
ncbi:12727_t:CDS:2, partial [Racocetra fulgida]